MWATTQTTAVLRGAATVAAASAAADAAATQTPTLQTAPWQGCGQCCSWRRRNGAVGGAAAGAAADAAADLRWRPQLVPRPAPQL
eukprot:14946293-Alexandrium_andersonii.AAC.1